MIIDSLIPTLTDRPEGLEGREIPADPGGRQILADRVVLWGPHPFRVGQYRQVHLARWMEVPVDRRAR